MDMIVYRLFPHNRHPNYHEYSSRIFTRACIEHRFSHVRTYRISAVVVYPVFREIPDRFARGIHAIATLIAGLFCP